ncbi:uncharacterized protein LOC127803155 [Diospyros lotus]|uniref:uncharacterized protein LOC127803155 n=1 Tax=Diospyros lotus TaxID=55363 RepID=UPI0022526FB4|nr:uncharacterized protein LOC127803155 [Diospyros lotus]
MGTEIQAKTFFSRSYSMRDQNDCTGSDLWAMYPELKTLKNDHYCNSFLTSPAIDVYLGHDKGQLRQTILKHEYIFRHQLEELHRLYKRQRDLMNEIKRELYQHQIPAEMSQSGLILSYGVKKTGHVSDSPLMLPTFGRYKSETDSIQPLTFAREKNTSGPFLSKDRITPKDCESTESKCSIFQRNMLNLELPASVHMHNKGKRIRESTCGVSGTESCSLARNRAVTPEVNLSLGSESGCNTDAFRCNIYSRGSWDMVDLNETIEVEEAPVLASVHNLGNVTCLDEDIQKQAAYVNLKSGVHASLKESSQISLSGRDGGICLDNMYPGKEGNQRMSITYKREAGGRTCNLDSFHQGLCPEYSPAISNPLKAEPGKVGILSSSGPSDINREPSRKRKIFGVEISEGILDQSVEASHTPSLHRPKPEYIAKSESSSLSTWSNATSIFGQDVLSIKEIPCISSSFTPNGSTSLPLQSLDVIRGKRQFSDSNSISVSRVEVSCQKDLCFGSQSDAKQLNVCSSSLGYEFPNGNKRNSSIPEQFMLNGSVKYRKDLSCMDAKCAKDVNSDMGILQQHPGSLDGQRRHENPMGELPWLKGKELAKVQPIKRQEGPCQRNLYSLHNYSEQFSDKTEFGNIPYRSSDEDPTSSSMRAGDTKLDRTDASAFPSGNKIFGFTISVLQTSRDLTSLSSHSNPNDVAANGNGSNDRKNLDQDPSSGVLEIKDLRTEKGLDNCISGLRRCIDLNLCMNEDEAPPVPSLPRAIVKIATTEIDLEAPVVLESETGPPPEADSSESPSKLPLDVSWEHGEDLVSVAAEAIVDISLSHLIKDITCHSSCGLSSDSLHWFAEVICNAEGDPEGGPKAVPTGTDAIHGEEFIPDGMDYFEFMTLKLAEIKVEEEEYCNKYPAPEILKNEETGATVSSKRPRRGQARRGRQRKDFQRDILPGIISLSKHDVIEDLQIIEELFRASGFTWQPRLSGRNTAKKGRGRTRAGASSPSVTQKAVCQPPAEHLNQREVVLEETLPGWGKRTRRLPRQRCPNDIPAPALKPTVLAS